MRAFLLALLLAGCAAQQRRATAPSFKELPAGRLVATAGAWGFPQVSRVTLLGGLGGPGLTDSGAVSASTGTFTGAVAASSYTASAASGSNAFIATSGAKFCLNASCTRYITETSSEIYLRGSRIVALDGGGYFNGLVDMLAGADIQGNIVNAGSTGALSINLNDADGTCVGNGTGTDCDGALSAATGAFSGAVTSSVASGANGFACAVNGCRVDIGTGANDYFFSDGANIYTNASIIASTISLAAVTISSNGSIQLNRVDGTGTPGSVTLNGPSGKAAVANAASSIVVTNNVLTATDRVLITPLSSSATNCAGWYVSAIAAGSFTLSCPVAATANWSFQFLVIH